IKRAEHREPVELGLDPRMSTPAGRDGQCREPVGVPRDSVKLALRDNYSARIRCNRLPPKQDGLAIRFGAKQLRQTAIFGKDQLDITLKRKHQPITTAGQSV